MSLEPGGGSTTAVEQSGPIGDGRTLATNARLVSLWTFASRLTGFLRVAIIAAILGPTYFGNLFQTALYVPYVLCELLAGTVIPPLLAPRLTRLLQSRGDAAALANGFFGAVLPLFVVVAVVMIAAAPLLLLVITAAVPDEAVRAEQIAIGTPLLIAFAPQVILTAIIATAVAVQHANGRFALPAAGQIIENLGLIAVLLAVAANHGWDTDLGNIPTGFAVTLGLGITAVVGLHALVQWLAAARLGVRLRPRWGWRNPEVRATLRAAVPAGGAATLGSTGWLIMMIACGHVAGGAVAFQIAQSIYLLPISLIARPIAVVQLRELALRAQARSEAGFRFVVRHGLRLTLFAIIPIAIGFLAFPSTLAAAVAQGRMADPAAVDLVSMALLGLAVGLVGEAVLVLATSAAYARHDVSSVFRSAAIRFLILGAGVGIVLINPGRTALLAVGLAYAVSSAVAAAYLFLRMRLGEPGQGAESVKWLSRTAAVALVALLPSAVLAWQRPLAATWPDPAVALLVVLVAVGLYALLQRLLASPELRDLTQRTPSSLADTTAGDGQPR